MKGSSVGTTDFLDLEFIPTKIVEKNADFISYVSQEFLQSRYSPPKRAIIVSVSNVEIPLLNEDILKKRLEKIELKNEKIVFGLIGSFKTKYKGIHNAIPVLGKLSKKYPNLEFRISLNNDTLLFIVLKILG